jgi:hypothetical protein
VEREAAFCPPEGRGYGVELLNERDVRQGLGFSGESLGAGVPAGGPVRSVPPKQIAADPTRERAFRLAGRFGLNLGCLSRGSTPLPNATSDAARRVVSLGFLGGGPGSGAVDTKGFAAVARAGGGRSGAAADYGRVP